MPRRISVLPWILSSLRTKMQKRRVYLQYCTATRQREILFVAFVRASVAIVRQPFLGALMMLGSFVFALLFLVFQKISCQSPFSKKPNESHSQLIWTWVVTAAQSCLETTLAQKFKRQIELLSAKNNVVFSEYH